MDHNEFSFCEVSDAGHDLHAALGRALALAARFEGNCRAFETLLIVRDENRKARTQEEYDEILYTLSRNVWDRRLGTRPESLAARYRGLLTIDLEGVLRSAVRARNDIAHDLGIGLCDRDTDDDHDARLEEVRSAVERIAEADRVITLLAALETHEPTPTVETYDAYPARAVRWVLEGEWRSEWWHAGRDGNAPGGAN